VIPTHYKYICVVEPTTLKMTKLVAETCRLSHSNKITFMTPQCIC